MIRLDLPLPPSTNSAYFNVPGKGRVPSAKHSEWKREAGWLIRLANPSPIIGPYRFTIKLPASLYGDIDNRVKLSMDLLVEHGVTSDDKHAVSSTAERCADVPSGRCLVIVSGVNEP